MAWSLTGLLGIAAVSTGMSVAFATFDARPEAADAIVVGGSPAEAAVRGVSLPNAGVGVAAPAGAATSSPSAPVDVPMLPAATAAAVTVPPAGSAPTAAPAQAAETEAAAAEGTRTPYVRNPTVITIDLPAAEPVGPERNYNVTTGNGNDVKPSPAAPAVPPATVAPSPIEPAPEDPTPTTAPTAPTTAPAEEPTEPAEPSAAPTPEPGETP